MLNATMRSGKCIFWIWQCKNNVDKSGFHEAGDWKTDWLEYFQEMEESRDISWDNIFISFV